MFPSIGSLTPWCCFWWKEKRLLIRRFGGVVDWASDENERSNENDDIARVEQFGNLGLFRFPFCKFINTESFLNCADGENKL